MALLVAGALLVALGLFSGVVLLAVPLALAPWSADPVLWVLFPLFSIVGYILFVIGARQGQARSLSLVLSSLLLLLGLLAAAALVLSAAAVIHPVGSTLSLWYVLIVAGALGAIGTASRSANEPRN